MKDSSGDKSHRLPITTIWGWYCVILEFSYIETLRAHVSWLSPPRMWGLGWGFPPGSCMEREGLDAQDLWESQLGSTVLAAVHLGFHAAQLWATSEPPRRGRICGKVSQIHLPNKIVEPWYLWVLYFGIQPNCGRKEILEKNASVLKMY